ncbi:NAD-dependent aldehyde dehydrogenase [Pseudomonas fluorescens R124]|uniref:NAD-dependent aldehyde dehydrogenase n=1 Tax=Pseudomonas fluorescens R124 TaxID=743713 RepID=A0A7U9GSM8_PSEFL|nr:NAD-dependent succinate-semialdehyde dehydrogenase [Pseudomonas fluorescens]EJZ58223.1 NAD-dependent aldehyde dehydrogenase [Pseudomonas fluorescens R124]
MAYLSVNPSDGQELERFEEISDLELEEKLAAANRCFQIWKHTSFAKRAAIISKAAELMHSRAHDFARLATLEMGKRIEEARAEVKFSADILDYYAQKAERFLERQRLHPKQGEAHIESSPIGIVFGVEPWNFPYYQLARIAGPQLMAGNVLVVKHAGCVPQCAIAFEALLLEAGAPAGLYTNLMISHEQSDRVVDDIRVKGIALTGSVPAGRLIAARAGANLKPSTMELGGSDAFIVLEDADLNLTLDWAVWGRMYNCGQTCCAAKRFIVVEDVADAFVERLQAAMAKFEPGNPMDESTTLGPLSSESALQRLLMQVDDAVFAGAQVLLGGERIRRPGSYMSPTILTSIATDNPAYRDEFFGPVALFFRVKDEEAAIALANDSDFGLGGSVFTRDVGRGLRVASQIDTGMMFINNISWSDAELPFGGIKNSGYGRELGGLGIQSFVNKKMVRYLSTDAPV